MQDNARFKNCWLFLDSPLFTSAMDWDQWFISHRSAEGQQIEVTFRYSQFGLSLWAGTEQPLKVLPVLWLTQLTVGLFLFSRPCAFILENLCSGVWKKKNQLQGQFMFLDICIQQSSEGEQFFPTVSVPSSQQWGLQETNDSWTVGSDAEKET